MVSSLSIPALPANPSRIILVNPTKYLGNLLIAGNLVQQFVEHCHKRNIEFSGRLGGSGRLGDSHFSGSPRTTALGQLASGVT